MDEATVKGKFKRLLKILKQEAPPPSPVHIVWVNKCVDEDSRGRVVEVDGSCERVEKNRKAKFIVRLPRSLRQSWPRLVEVLIHEWAHANAWTPDHPNYDEHSPEWGVAYSRCYRAFEKYSKREEARENGLKKLEVGNTILRR